MPILIATISLLQDERTLLSKNFEYSGRIRRPWNTENLRKLQFTTKFSRFCGATGECFLGTKENHGQVFSRIAESVRKTGGKFTIRINFSGENENDYIYVSI